MAQSPRPRLRASFWFEGEAAKCELVLMTEQRELVHRQTLSIAPGTGLEQVHAGLLSAAATLARAHKFAAEGGAPPPAAAPAPPAPPEPAEPAAPALSPEELTAERERRAGLQAKPQAEELEPPVLEPPVLELERMPAPTLTAEEFDAERRRRVALQAGSAAVVDNKDPDPTV